MLQAWLRRGTQRAMVEQAIRVVRTRLQTLELTVLGVAETDEDDEDDKAGREEPLAVVRRQGEAKL